MAVINESWGFEMPHNIDKEISPLETTVSGDTMCLEEDETMREDDDDSLCTEFVSSCCCMEDDDIDDITSCCSEDDIISCSSIQLDDDEMDDNIFSTRAARRVRFAPNERSEHLIISLSEFTEDEIEAAWYSKNQQKVMNKANNKTVKRLDSGLKEKSSAPYRGLEQFGIDGYLHMEEAQRAYVDTVMDEMLKQWGEQQDDNGVLDWEKIASLTEEISRQSSREAFIRALFDENEARAAYQIVKVKDLEVQQQQEIAKRDLLESSTRIAKERNLVTPTTKEKSNKKNNKRDEMSRLDSFIRTAEDEGRGLLSPSVKTKKKNKVKAGLKPRLWMKSLLKKL